MDKDKRAVYAVEALLEGVLQRGGQIQVAGSTLTLPVERKFGNLDNVRDYVSRLHQVFGGDRDLPRVRERKGQSRAHYEPGTNTIAVPVATRWALRETVILHEYAHHLTRFTGDPGHGQTFRGNYAHLLDEVIGAEVGFLFRFTIHQELGQA